MSNRAFTMAPLAMALLTMAPLTRWSDRPSPSSYSSAYLCGRAASSR